MNLSPIVLFVYNRPWHTIQTVEALLKNDLKAQSNLIIFADAAKDDHNIENVKEVINYIKTINGFKSVTIYEREINYGLADSIIDGVTSVIDAYGRVIVLEDDLVTSPLFLKYMNESLEHFENEKHIFSITGYNFPSSLMKIPANYIYDTYLNYRCMSWGWGTWKDRWNITDWEVKDFNSFIKNTNEVKLFNRGGKDLARMLKLQMAGEIDSWAIRWCYAHFRNQAFCSYPVKSLLKNIGHDGSGTHCGVSNLSYNQTQINPSWRPTKYCNDPNDYLNKTIMKNFYQIYNTNIAKEIMFLVKDFQKKIFSLTPTS